MADKLIIKDEEFSRNDALGLLGVLNKVSHVQGYYKNIKRVKVYKMADFLKQLSNLNYNYEEITRKINFLVEEGDLFKVVKLEKEIDGKESYDILLTEKFTVHDSFILKHEKHEWINYYLLYIFIFILAIITVTVYCPRWHNWTLYYLKYPVIGFLGFLLVAFIVRWIVYFFTLFLCDMQLWIWPNLFADCGFFESFVPSYIWVNDHQKMVGEDK